MMNQIHRIWVRWTFVLTFGASFPLMWGQDVAIEGTILDQESKTPLQFVTIELDDERMTTSDQEGRFSFSDLEQREYTLICSLLGYDALTQQVPAGAREGFIIYLKPSYIEVGDAVVADSSQMSDMDRMASIQNTSIYRGMKSEIVRPAEMKINLSTNNSRQAYSKVPGINVWESDGAGIQLGIGGRGLSPNRTSHFNVRQNGYDISADPLGYPESYYTPPLDVVERIEIVRGAASLQYGTQFGGLLNFAMKDGLESDGNEIVVKQTVASFGLNDTIASSVPFYAGLVSLEGKHKRVRYFSYYQYKGGSGWRPNSGFDVHTAYGMLEYSINESWTIKGELTHMNYLAQQPGGLTDSQFAFDPRASNRERNWFRVRWNLAALKIEHVFSPMTQISSQFSGLYASRAALGFLGETQRPDPLTERDLISGEFKNVSNETRLIHRYVKNDKLWALAAGFRVFSSENSARQGSASAGDDPDFTFLSGDAIEESDYLFPNTNFSLFTQGIVPITKRLSVTPGVRYEVISTQSDGDFRTVLLDGAGNLIESRWIGNEQDRSRDFLLLGTGLTYTGEGWECYANAVQNYRAINFSDIQIRNTSLVIDTLIEDERGFNLDLGVRGTLRKRLNYDFSLFMLSYQDRIGEVNRNFDLLGIRRYRTNISDATSKGVEMFAQYNLLTGLRRADSTIWSVDIFANGSLIDAQYTNPDDDFFYQNRVELVPEYTYILGASMSYGPWSYRVQWTSVGEQFSDAGNVGSDPAFPATANAIDGIIPAYEILDMGLAWKKGVWSANLSINNVLNRYYFTRRASGYPGPGIIPSDGRAVYLGIAITV